MIITQNLTKRYGEVIALDDVNLQIARGEFIALLGPNGSGKSTFFRSLLGIHDYEGTIRINGCDPLRQGKETRRKISYMPQHSGLHGDLTVQETISFYSRLKRVAPDPNNRRLRAESLLEKVQLDHKLDSHVSELSGGMRQRLAFAVALLSDPEIMLLDEPTASLDAKSQGMILEWLTELHAQGKTILISTHSKQDIMSLAVRAISLEDGRVISDRNVRSVIQNEVMATSPIDNIQNASSLCYAN